jgi:xylulose-5-phosphate/fructose-6-phosphate phosphoketolase
MVVRNNMDRFQLAIDTIHRIPGLKADDAVAIFQGELAKHKEYVAAYGKDMPEVENWRWSHS